MPSFLVCHERVTDPTHCARVFDRKASPRAAVAKIADRSICATPRIAWRANDSLPLSYLVMHRSPTFATVFAFVACAFLPTIARAQDKPTADELADEEVAPTPPNAEKPKQVPEAPKTDAPDTWGEAEPDPPPETPAEKAGDPAPAESTESNASEAGPGSDADAEAEAAAAEQAALEDEALMGDENPGRPPPKGKGVVWGVIQDSVEKEPMPEATVTVVGTKFKTVADVEGRYRLELPPGKYTIRFFFELHRPALVKDVIVRADQVGHIDAEVVPDEASVETFEVETQADTTSIEGQVLARQRATAVGDGVGRAEISKSPASNAAQAAQRVVGATIVGGRFVYVRGLGERYTNALLNDAPLPSPEPDRAAIPLDLFPALILDNLTIVKTFTPDAPADFAGGSVRIQTRELPSKPLFQASVALGFDDKATFRERLAQRSSPTDFVGFDSGMRALPENLEGRSLTDLATEDERLVAARKINSYMSSVRKFTPPNYSLSAVAGSGWALPKEQRLGALVTVNYSRGFQLRDDTILRNFRIASAPNGIDTIVKPANDYKAQFGNDRVNWGALGSVSYWPAQQHRLTVLGVHTQLADSQAQVVEGYNDSRSANIVNTRLAYVSRALNFGQLRGEHDFGALGNARLEWNGALSHASRSQPDTRDTVFQSSQGSDYVSINTPENGAHFYSAQGETTRGGGLDWTQPFSKEADASKAKFGGLLSLKARDFRAQRFHFSSASMFSCGPAFSPECPDDIYVDSNVESRVLELAEDTLRNDAYTASLDVYAAYGMLDLSIFKSLRVIGGARIEVTRQKIDPYSQFAAGGDDAETKLGETDVLPSLGIVYSLTKSSKLRASATRTLARPQIRELAPFVFSPYFGAKPFAGNPDLKLTYINNGDLRFEYYPTQREVMAFSFFYKDFESPIENIVLDAGSDGIVQPQNAAGGKLVGLELEARKSLESVAQALKDFSVIGNLTLAKSKVELDMNRPIRVTSFSRAMVYQSPFVVNLAVDYANESAGSGVRLLYNVSGRRLVEVGTGDLPDSYEHPKHVVDLTISQNFGKHVQMKLTGANLFGADHVVTIGSENRDDRIQERYSEPRIFAISGTYTH